MNGEQKMAKTEKQEFTRSDFLGQLREAEISDIFTFYAILVLLQVCNLLRVQQKRSSKHCIMSNSTMDNLDLRMRVL